MEKDYVPAVSDAIPAQITQSVLTSVAADHSLHHVASTQTPTAEGHPALTMPVASGGIDTFLGGSTSSFLDDLQPSRLLMLALVEENTALKNKVKELRSEVELFRGKSNDLALTLHMKGSELDLLRQQNDRLKEEVNALNVQLAEFRLENTRLRSNEQTHIKQLRLLQNELLYTKYVNAIQDANALYNLENVLPPPHCEHMKSLHSDRVGATHYVYTFGKYKDNPDQQLYKMYELHRRLKSLPPRTHQALLRRYGDVVDEVSQFLENLKIPDTCVNLVSQDDIDQLAEWWLD